MARPSEDPEEQELAAKIRDAVPGSPQPHAEISARKSATVRGVDGNDQGGDRSVLEVSSAGGRADLSNDIEKDINIDVAITGNSASTIQYVSNITINYYNCEAGGGARGEGRPGGNSRNVERPGPAEG